MVIQSPYLFGTSIRQSIALADPSLSLERVIEAARLAIARQVHHPDLPDGRR